MGEPPLPEARKLHIIQDPAHVLTYMGANLEYAFLQRKNSPEVPTGTFEFTLGVGLLQPLRDQMELGIGELFVKMARQHCCDLILLEWSIVAVQDNQGFRYSVSLPFVRFVADEKQLLEVFSGQNDASHSLQ